MTRLNELLRGAAQTDGAVALLAAVASRLWLPHSWRDFTSAEGDAVALFLTAAEGAHLPPAAARLLAALARNGFEPGGALRLTRETRAEDLPRLCVAVHVAILAAAHGHTHHPLAVVYADPRAGAAIFLPAAPTDEEAEIINALLAGNDPVTRYQCDRCHYRYFIANCGRPVQGGVCPECRNPIGGAAYLQLHAGNTAIDAAPRSQRTDAALPGYTFAPIGERASGSGSAAAPADLFSSVRQLQPAAYRALRCARASSSSYRDL